MNKKRSIIGLKLHKDDEVDPEEWKHSLLFKIISDNTKFKIATVKDNMTTSWKPVKIVSIIDLGSDIGLVNFASKDDLFHVWSNGPWNFFHHLIVLEKVWPSTPLSNHELRNNTFWTHFHNILITHHSISIVVQLGELISTPTIPLREEVKKWVNYIRIKVLIDVSEPLYESVEFFSLMGELVNLKFIMKSFQFIIIIVVLFGTIWIVAR